MLTRIQKRRYARAFVCTLAVVFCAYPVAGCAPGTTAATRLTNATPARLHAEARVRHQAGPSRKAEPEVDCKLQPVVLGDTWLDGDNARKRSDHEPRCYGHTETAAHKP